MKKRLRDYLWVEYDMCLMGRDTVIYGLIVDPSNCLMLSVLMLEVMS